MRKLIYDWEVFPNLATISIKELNKTGWFTYILYNDKELALNKAQLIELITDNMLIGYNSKSYDDLMLDYLLCNGRVTNAELKAVSDSMIDKEDKMRKSWKIVRKSFISKFLTPDYRQPYYSFDLIFNYKDGLKKYEHTKGYLNIEETPISFDATVDKKTAAEVLKYNQADVLATEQMYLEYEPLTESLLEFKDKYKIEEPIEDQSYNIVDEFFKTVIDPPAFDKELVISLDHPELRRLADKIEDENIKKHIIDLVSLPTKTIPFDKWKREDSGATLLYQYNDYVDLAEPSFSVEIMNATLQFGVGGLHSFVLPIALQESDTHTIIDADFNSMYPFIIMNMGLAPFYFDDAKKKLFLEKYKELIDLRFKLKAEDSKFESAYKLILNITTGKFKERFSEVFDPSLHTVICTMAQYLIFYTLKQVEPLVDKIAQVNTDGISLYVTRENEQKVRDILLSISKEFNMDWKFVNYKNYFASNVNNYYAETTEGKVKVKGAAFNLETESVPKVIKKVLIEYFKTKRNVPEILDEHNDIIDYCFFASRNGVITVEKNGELIPNNLNKHIRYYIAIDGVTVKADGKLFSNSDNVIVQNHITDPHDTSNVNKQFYINDIEETIFEIENSIQYDHTEVLEKFKKIGLDSELCGKHKMPQKDENDQPTGCYIYKRTSDAYGTSIMNYPTVGITTENKISIVDIDTWTTASEELAKMCFDTGTMYSVSDTNEHSLRFIFLTRNLTGHRVRKITKPKDDTKKAKKSVEFELFAKYKNKTCISGFKFENEYGEITQNYVLKGDVILPMPDDIENYILSATEYSSPAKKDSEIGGENHNQDMKRLYELANNPNFKLNTVSGKTRIILKKRPSWFKGDGSWTKTTCSIFQNTHKENFDVFIYSHKDGFGEEEKKTLKAELIPFINQINTEKTGEIFDTTVLPETTPEVNNEIETFLNTKVEEPQIEKLPQISDELYIKMPTMLNELTKDYSGDLKDVILLSLLSNVSVYFLNMKSSYWGSICYPNIYTITVAKTAGGKSIIKKPNILVAPLDKLYRDIYTQELNDYRLEIKNNKGSDALPPIRILQSIRGDINKPAIIQSLSDNAGKLLMFTTELDSLIGKGEWEDWTPLLRDGIMNDRYTKKLKGSDFVDIPTLRLSLCGSGTMDQIPRLLGKTGNVNGTFNRFMWYNMTEEFRLTDPHGKIIENNKPFEDYGKRLLDLYQLYFKLDDFYEFDLTDTQKQTFFDRLSKSYNETINWEDNSTHGIILRHGLFAKKIMMLFAGLRCLESHEAPSRILTISDQDVETVWGIIDVLQKHSIDLFKPFIPKEFNSASVQSWKRQFWSLLGQKFSRDEYQKIGLERIKKGRATLDNCVTNWVQNGDLKKIGKFGYEKQK